VFALASSLLIGYTLQFVNAAAQEKAWLYDRFRDVLYKLDDFLRGQDQSSALIQVSRVTSWELKRPRRRDFPSRDWERRVSKFMEEAEKHKKTQPQSNLHLEISAFLGDCESAHNEMAICWVKQLIAPLLVRSAIKMLILLCLLLVSLFTMLSMQGVLPLEVHVGVPAFFVMAAILVCVELGLTVWRHSREMTEESLSGGLDEELEAADEAIE
jgi:hypothetical protein